MEAINSARDAKIDVVLIDTAGRMQDNEPLMKALAKVIFLELCIHFTHKFSGFFLSMIEN